MAGSKSNTYKPQPYSVNGKTAIVTGAGSGINFSFASLLLSKGCNVLIADLSLRPEAQALLTQYPDSPKAIFHATDVTDWTQLEAAFTAALTHFPSIDILCPGAGIYDPAFSNFWHPPGSSLSRDSPTGNGYTTLDINITHPIRATQLAIAHFLNHAPTVSVQNPKRVLIISSIAGQNSNLHTPLYVAAKHAMNGFVRSFEALEPRTGIRINAVAPGVIKTPLWTEHPEKMRFIDEGKDEWATPEEVAVAMLRCLEDEDLVGGTILEVGKGQTRLVEALNDPGPSGRGHTVSNLHEKYEEVYELLGTKGWGIGKAKL